MKKQTKKLTLNKKTISNLAAAEMGKHVGGGSRAADRCGGGGNGSKECSQNALSCPGHKTCPYSMCNC